MMKLKIWALKVFKFEFWPWQVFYLPLIPYYLYLALKNRDLFFPANVNTSLKAGGFFKENKAEVLLNISENYLPKSILVENTHAQIDTSALNFPMVAKPVSGQRGKGVTKILDNSQLSVYQKSAIEPFVLQEFVDYPIELAVLYSRLPGQAKGIVSSVTSKEFLTMEGDGQQSIKELVLEKPRTAMLWETLQKNVKINWEQILDKGEKKLLEPIGNHCRGTIFLNEKNIDKEKLANVCDEILKDFEGFNYGRFDMKVSSVSELYDGKGIQVLELNGVNADAAHIFDPNYSLFQAYSDVMWHWNKLSEISLANIKNGEKVKSAHNLFSFYKIVFPKESALVT